MGEEREGEVFGFRSTEEHGVLDTASNSSSFTAPSSIRDELCSDTQVVWVLPYLTRFSHIFNLVKLHSTTKPSPRKVN